jgi:glycosyltransferase involved in cell wall biosynthesis
MARRVSVVIPVHNEERFIGEALASVFAQDDPALEVIVVDDGSTDDSAATARACGDGVRVVRQEQQGTAAALNRGVREATGSLIAFLDADDRWTGNKLCLQRQALDAQPALDFVLAQMRNVADPGLTEAERRALVDLDGVLTGACPGAMLIRRTALDRVGPFATRWRVGEYLDWFIRAREAGLTHVVVPEVLLERRIHDGNKGRLLRDAQVDYLAIIQEARDRARAPR